ncbi:hypothetical protein [Kitasatospora purpeofusca]|uniref:hypothetical protein n=1 Tax=Kitasatospora purpeofusca TaxID=67352 RepID=UPI0036D3B3C2
MTVGGTGPDPRWEARAKLTAALKDLRARAESSAGRPLTNRQICAEVPGEDGRKLSKRLSAWFTGVDRPSSDEVAWRVISFLERCVGSPVRTPQQWNELLRGAREEARRNKGGRSATTYRPTPLPPLRHCRTADQYRPQELKGREKELARLHELVGSRSGYLSLVGPPWAGKTALLATFAATCTLPDTDLVAYFVRWKTGSDTARYFRDTMIRVLSGHVGKRPASRDTGTLLELYDAAARKSVECGRKLLLLIDGLDEDAVGTRDGQIEESIASLLPPRPYPGLVVLVSRRRHPPLPDDVPSDHPLRDAYPITGIRPSPEAAVLRGVVRRDLEVLLRDSGAWGREIVGFLAVAGGGLTEPALMQLVGTGGHDDMPIPYDLAMRLHSVAGRGVCLEDLEPDEFVLAHKDLYREALAGLGSPMCSALLHRLHAWADGFREEGWPATTPGYLLHRYLDLLARTDDVERRAAFTLDHRRLALLAAAGRTDLALSAVDQLAQELPTPAVLASAAASGSLLATGARPVPHEVLRALCLVGDSERARSLALGAGDPASKAARLAEVVRALSVLKTPDAAGKAVRFAREAAGWAERSERQPGSLSVASEWDAGPIVPCTAVVLAEVGLTDEAVRLLSCVDIRRPENVEPLARAAGLLRGADRAFSDRVSEELLLEAENQAESAEGDPVLAVEIWASVAAHDPGRGDRALARMRTFSEGFAVVRPGLAAADCCAVTASALARSAPEDGPGETWKQARELADTARSAVLGALDAAWPDELSGSLALLVQALLDLGELPTGIRGMLAGFPAQIAARAESLLDGDATTDEDQTGDAEAEVALLHRVRCSSELGDGPQLRSDLDRYLSTSAAGEAQVAWLPHLSEALAGTDDEAGSALVLSAAKGGGSLLQVRCLAAAARAHAEGGRQDAAVRCATEAARTVACLDPQPPEARALVAQAFAHAGEAERAASWAQPPSGRRPFGRAGIPYRRAALAVRAGLEPAAFVAEVVAEGLPGGGLSATGSDLVEAFRSLASGAQVEARIASLRTLARTRLAAEPLLATGLALLQAVRGDGAGACRTVGEVPDPAARGVAQATVAGCLSGVPAYLDVAGDEDNWMLSVFRVLAHQLRPAGAGGVPLASELVVGALGTDSWYRALPLLGRTDAAALHAVVEVLDRHGRAGIPVRAAAADGLRSLRGG